MSFRKRTKTNKANAVTIYTRVKEHPDVFCVKNSLLFYNYCDFSQSLEITLLVAESKREVVANANISLEKINYFLPFFKNILKKKEQFLKP
ncbi:hypothetical protein RhiirC2_794933 [Rhizophagus irregularis]|uniref:Uncharacterized protein n=1 Tax=Rhizophagus irregularis TaxID=588596 RepID=A0A2N1MCL9_9GLOM|nr:hypothetical protein RhiirC2_794933 [Rhizophagus irregularis]